MASPVQNMFFGGGAAYVRALGEPFVAGVPRPSNPTSAEVKFASAVDTVQANRDYARLAAFKEDASAVASKVRDSVRNLQQAQELVDAMRERSLAIIKNYPPFPPGSEERRQYLESIEALRRQIEALTYPPPRRSGEDSPAERITLPVLDPLKATDTEVAAFDQALVDLAEALAERLAALREMIAAIPDLYPNSPQLPSAEAAADLSRVTAALLATPGPGLSRQGLERINA